MKQISVTVNILGRALTLSLTYAGETGKGTSKTKNEKV